MTEQEGFQQNQPHSAQEIYSEVIIGKTTYCVTSIFAGNLNVVKTLEELAISEIIHCINAHKRQRRDRNEYILIQRRIISGLVKRRYRYFYKYRKSAIHFDDLCPSAKLAYL